MSSPLRRRRNRHAGWLTLAVVGALLSSACGLLIGSDEDYHLRSGAPGSGAASTGAAGGVDADGNSGENEAGTSALGRAGSSASTGGAGNSSMEVGGAGAVGVAGSASLGGQAGTTGIHLGGDAGMGGADPFCDVETCPPKSCGAVDNTVCGSDKDSCCSWSLIDGAPFLRYNSPDFSGQVSDFVLDKYEVTVARFRQFVAVYPDSKPHAGDGANRHVSNDLGWLSAWDDQLPKTQGDLESRVSCTDHTYTHDSGARDLQPVNCIDWYVAYAFCAWDGGRLPTFAEFDFAEAGGAEQRYYPWSKAPDDMAIDSSDAQYGMFCPSCGVDSLLPVGSKPNGKGRWGQADLAGNAWEWALDEPSQVVRCDDCAQVPQADSTRRTEVGGGFDSDANLLRVSSAYNGVNADETVFMKGFRCARNAR